VLIVNGVLSVGCYGLLASLSPTMPIAVIGMVLFLSGILRSVGFTAYVTLAFSDVDGDRLTHANTLNAAVQELASGLGIATAALLLSTFSPLASTAHTAYAWTFLVLGVLMALTVVESFRLPRDAATAVTAS
jgi:phosphatidylserine synthase